MDYVACFLIDYVPYISSWYNIVSTMKFDHSIITWPLSRDYQWISATCLSHLFNVIIQFRIGMFRLHGPSMSSLPIIWSYIVIPTSNYFTITRLQHFIKSLQPADSKRYALLRTLLNRPKIVGGAPVTYICLWPWLPQKGTSFTQFLLDGC